MLEELLHTEAHDHHDDGAQQPDTPEHMQLPQGGLLQQVSSESVAPGTDAWQGTERALCNWVGCFQPNQLGLSHKAHGLAT